MNTTSTPAAAPVVASSVNDRDEAIRVWHAHCAPFKSWLGTIPPSPVIDAMLTFARAGAPPAEPDCPHCQGSGEVTAMTGHLGPDDYEYQAPCDHCGGEATLEAAYLGVVKLLEKEQAESRKLSGKLWALRHSSEARDAFLLELGEDLARWHNPFGYWQERVARTWVPVSTRLPEKNVEVLVMLSAGSVASTGQYTGNPHDQDPAGWCYPGENCGTCEDGSNPVVTHWMPLPAAPTAQPSRT